MTVRQLEAGARRGREPVRARRLARRQPRGARADLRGLRGRRSQVARRRRDSRSRATGSATSTASTTPSSSSRSTQIATKESSACISGHVLRGLKKPATARRSARECTPQQPARRDDGLGRGRLRRVLPVRALLDPPVSGGARRHGRGRCPANGQAPLALLRLPAADRGSARRSCSATAAAASSPRS